MRSRRKRVVKFLVITAIHLLVWLILVAIEAATGGVPVLMYHEVVASDDESGRYELPASMLEEQLRYLKKAGYATVTDRDLLAARSGAPFSEKPVILTFDDGSEDHYTRVFPLLKQYGFTGVFFVMTSRLGRPGSLTDAQVLEMHQAGMSIQSHSGSARHLDVMPAGEAHAEMTQSWAALEQVLHTQPVSFCVPGGRYNDQILSQAKDTGYQLVFTSDSGRNLATGDRLTVRRLEIRGTTSLGRFKRFNSPVAITNQKISQRLKHNAKRLTGWLTPPQQGTG